MPYRQRDIILANCQLPSGTVPHPYLILSNETVREFENVYVVVMLTSSLRDDEFSFLLEDSTMTGPLPKRSEIRCHLITVLSEQWIVKKLSTIKINSFNEVVEKIVSEVINSE